MTHSRGAAGFLPKPFGPKEVRQMISTVISSAGNRDIGREISTGA